MPTKTWRVWLHTDDWINGTFLCLHDNGSVERITTDAEQGDLVVLIKPKDG